MMKQLATGMTLALMCLPAMAESEAGFYSGVSVGQVTLKDNIDGFSIKRPGPGTASLAAIDSMNTVPKLPT